MRKRLHPHLEDGLDFEELKLSGELLEELPEDYRDPDKRAAKRQRIEKVATDYLRRAQPPVLLSARLHGPFNRGWKNPWGPPPLEQSTQKTAGTSRGGESSLATVQSLGDSNVREHSATQRHAVGSRKSSKEQADGRGVKAPGTGSAVREEHIEDRSSIGARSHLRVSRRTPGENEQWLKRRVEDWRRKSTIFSHYTPAGSSPTPSGREDDSFRSDGEQCNTPPKPPTVTRPSPAVRSPFAVDRQWRSSASAPMDISSPVRQISPIDRHSPKSQVHTCTGTTPLNRHGPILDHTQFSSQLAQQRDSPRWMPESTVEPSMVPTASSPGGLKQQTGHAYTILVSVDKPQPRTKNVDSSVSRQKQATPVAAKDLRSGRGSVWPSVNRTNANEQLQDTPSRGPIQDREEPYMVVPNTLAGTAKKRRSDRNVQDDLSQDSEGIHPPLQRVFEPANSFTYRKVGDRKTKKGAQKPKPRPINFDSSPAIRKDDKKRSNTTVGPELQPQAEEAVEIERPRGDQLQSNSQRPHIYDLVPDEQVSTQASANGDRRESGLSRQSLYSTQAAMMLAQLEFQEGTYPSCASDTPRSASETPRQPMNFLVDTGTPASTMREPSPVITPFHAFNAELDKKHPDSEAPELPISTQDLFNAASPFAFSTIKKRPMASAHRSNLRFSVLVSEDRSQRSDGNAVKSPTPSAERVPLKERNSHVSWKSSQEMSSQESVLSSPFRPAKSMDLPLLASLPSLGGDLSFTDQFLRNLGDLG